jgi:uncharacterized cysteine cluster protein YcgN (CxxCxxCC family)
MSQAPVPFWKTKRLSQMTKAEWESLCDGCGKCCLHKLEDDETGRIYFTNVACRLLDPYSCRCADYPNRKSLVPDCVVLTPKALKSIEWLPETCAYRLVAEGRDLFDWHPLVSGDPESVHKAGISMRKRVISETVVTDLEDYILDEAP